MVEIGSMDSVQVGKEVFVKVSFANVGFEPRTFSICHGERRGGAEDFFALFYV